MAENNAEIKNMKAKIKLLEEILHAERSIASTVKNKAEEYSREVQKKIGDGFPKYEKIELVKPEYERLHKFLDAVGKGEIYNIGGSCIADYYQEIKIKEEILRQL